ncbi:MAG: peptide chain release factor N(5)-glutamine methyltransferase [Burkholderiales bacterium]|nr:peptide chain release factor N(5)-glutamine methyltransferase [Burkholderiales bacterium]
MTTGSLTVAQALLEARALGVDRLDTLMLLGDTLACSRTWLLAHDDAALSLEQETQLRARLARRATGEPLAYLLGEKEFHGLMLEVDANVLVPRPDTEVLVDWALELLAGAPDRNVGDLGTGSGAIALAVKHAQPVVTMTATDVSPAALGVARANANRLALDVEFIEGSWWQAVPRRRFHLVLSNPPYIAAGDEHLAALGHEPTLALTPGGDGLDALRCIVAGAAAHLEPRGWLLLEHGFDQADAVQALLREHGFADIQTRHDLAGQPRCSGAHRP